MPLRYRHVTYRYTAPGGDVEQLFRRIWELNRQQTFTTRTRWRPPTDVLEGPKGLLVKIEIAGMGEDDFDVTLFEDVLVVAGRRDEHPGNADRGAYESRYHESGVRYGEFQVEVVLPLAVDADRVTAHYDRGFLVITLPRQGTE